MKGCVILAHLFSQVPRAEIPRSRFNRNHSYKTTLNAGVLVPFLWDSILPGDSFRVNTKMFCRMATLISPIMDDLWIDTHYFFVPYRLVWDNFQKFMGEQRDPDDSIDYVVPQGLGSAKSNPVSAQSLADYLGLPIGTLYGSDHETVSALPFRAYYLIWNEWFRDENLQDSVRIQFGDNGILDGPISNSFKSPNIADSCLPRSKRHDYFTSALPWPAKPLNGSVSINVPLNGSAQVYGNGKSLGLTDGTMKVGIFDDDSHLNSGTRRYNVDVGTVNTDVPSQSPNNELALGVVGKGDESGLIADLTTATGVTINQLRESFQIQRFLEKCARGGTRYTEMLRSMFGVISPDARLQRPEYLGGTSQRLDVNVIPQTSASIDDSTPQANLSAFATGAISHDNGFTKSFVEHGVVIGLVSIRGPLIYQQGLNREWSKKTRFDFYWPTFAHLGEQAILNKEIYLQGDQNVDNEVFGYQERYAEYRYFPSLVTGKFRSTYAQSLDSWHLAQKFDNLPTLSNQFIQEAPPISRVIAVQDEPQFLLDCYIEMDCARPMPLYGVPGLIDHF